MISADKTTKRSSLHLSWCGKLTEVQVTPRNQPRTFPVRVERKRSDRIEQITVTVFYRLHCHATFWKFLRPSLRCRPRHGRTSPRSIPPSGRFLVSFSVQLSCLDHFFSRYLVDLVEIGRQNTCSSRVCSRAWWSARDTSNATGWINDTMTSLLIYLFKWNAVYVPVHRRIGALVYGYWTLPVFC